MRTIERSKVPDATRRYATRLLIAAGLSLCALPAHAADINVTTGTLEVDDPADIGANRVVVDNTADEDATLKINAGVTVGAGDFLLNNGGALINEGTISRSGSGYNGAYGDTGLAHVTNQAGGAITVDDIGISLKGGGSLLNTGTGTSIAGRIGVVIWGTSTITNELGASIHGMNGAGLYLFHDADSTIINRSGATISSDAAEGIIVFGTGSVINTGEDSAISGFTKGIVINEDGAEVENLDGGSISGGDTAVWLGGGGTVTNGAESIITGGQGVYANHATTVNNSGTIEGTADEGLYLHDGGIVNNYAGSSITGSVGIRAGGSTAVDNAGSIEGTVDEAITATTYGSSLNNHDGGTISSSGNISVDIGGNVTNTGTGSKISGDGDGVRTLGGATLRNEDGAEIEAEYLAINMYDGGDVYNTGGSKITSNSTDAIDVWIYGSVTNSGEGSAITAGGYAGVYFNPDVAEDVVFTLTNSDKATIQGDSYGVSFDGAEGNLTNEGGATITSVAGSGITMSHSGSVTNRSGGVVTGPVTGLYLRNDDDSYSFTVTNTGEDSAILATGIDGVFADADGIFITGTDSSVTNADGASISGIRFGAWMNDGGSFTNEGDGTSIEGGTAILTSQTATIINRNGGRINGVLNGIEMDAGGTVSNESDAVIDASDDDGIGALLTNGGSVTNKTGAGITADGNNGTGVKLEHGGSLLNESGATISGTMRGAQGWGADITNTGSGSAITSDDTAVQTWAGGGSVTNADGAVMHGGINGVLLDTSTALENSGGAQIIGDTADGVLSYNGGIVTNTGAGSLIQGEVAGVELQGGPGTVINTDGATITAGYGAIGLFQGGSVTNGAGATLNGGTFSIYAEGGAAVVSNAGAITGDVALDGGYDNDVTLFTGGSINGNLYINNRAGSTLTFDGTGTQLLSDAVTGTFAFGGVVTKQGSGTWIIDKNLLADETNVTDGTLIVGVDGVGKLFSDVNVSHGATLGGSGTIYGDVVVDGTVAPGNSPGVLSVAGNYTQTAGSTFNAQIDTDSGLYDRINASGTATIDPGATLNVMRTGNAPYVVGTQYVFLSATSGVTGTYAVAGDLVISPFLSLTDHYDPGLGYLEVEQTLSLVAALTAPTTSQISLANAIQSAPASPVSVALTNLPSVAALNALLPQLTGEFYPSVAGAMLEDSRYLRNAATDRIDDASCGDKLVATKDCSSNPVRLWSSAIGAWAHDNSAAGVAAMSRTSGGMLFGADTTYNDFWRAGLLTGYGVTHFEMNNRASTATSEDLHLGFYTGSLPGPLAVKLGAMRTWHHVAAGRSASITGFYNHLDADYHAATTQVFGEAGYRLAATGNKVQPFANVTYVNNRAGDFSESGGAAALSAQGSNNDMVLSTLGLHLNDTLTMGTAKIAAKGTLGWRHASGDTTPATDFTIGGSTPYRIDGLPVSRNALMMKADIETAINGAVTFGLSADGQFSRDKAAMGLQARLAVNF